MQSSSTRRSIKSNWVDSLKDAFYDADDLLDEFSTDVLVKRMMTGNKMVKEVRLFFSSSNPFVYGLKMAHKIGKVRSKLDETVANRKFHLDEIAAPMVEEREQTHSSLPLVVVGREDDKKKIIDFLLSSSYGENVSIISIVGVGGLGKTTLAQLAYNDVRVKSYFELKMWVCISENFDVKIVVEKILESLDGIEFLPDSIIKLQNLQILRLVNCERLKQLPKHIKKLVNLQQLFLKGCVSLTHMPHGIGQLTSIENLSLFMVDKDNSVSKHGGALSELSNLNNLRDMLRIMNLRYVKNPTSEFEAANLKEKQLIQSLRLSWKLGPRYDNDSDSGPDDVENDGEMSLEELRPHLNLKWLIVFGCGRLLFPSWISSLTNLVELQIDNCKKCQHFPPLDQFPSLKHLTIENLTDLEYIESGINCDNALFFPSLVKLWLINCPNLKGWRRDTSTPQLLQFHCLDYLDIRSCPNLTSMPLIPSVQRLVLINASKKSLEDILKMKISVSQSTSYSISSSQLKFLYIEGIEDLEVLPEDLWHLTSLESCHQGL
ncbi:hypothetical protein GH714_016076 [Hevea brasiliensis]|uniref:NB-ARC domain-containing protein n=1 Tax=Hevea brasiliensis TaxID=3981 RepID=A0A6A6N4Q4_HEVBR|nr:hypothetical protein GH714_016076 [Hevea brasiliensis]